MKNKIALVALILTSYLGTAQVQVPQMSTKAKIEQVVGLTDISIEYTRPNMRGRSVFGDLVPYGRMWRTGANVNTIVTFSDDVVIDGKTLKKGKYALYTLPKAESWDVFFYANTNNWGLPETWDDSKVALKTTVKPIPLNRNIETFTLAFSNVNIDGADLEISWEKTMVAVHIEVPSEKLALASIDQVLAGPKATDYFASAQYYFSINKDMNKALNWINQAIEMSGAQVPYYFLRLKSQIQAKLGDKKGAIETAKKSLELAQTANNADYIKMNKDSILEWSK
ncbi:DUF2911 domain-containing protein [Flavobacterium sp. NKUCC04_CG]|uniref:DUF2911 domain-containing protein n=1 Tax=Flavobacterium sp. NKUCC04_CG TaxID=2842121 RepID=UPI001C5BBCE6|nr:DUF2911 domain-containing protein [Flavobacterium sp. NKUCC04_CG]MBW3519293.1 DUF2911 domain-containing protein [Flavobacterium sp. NKUCC04_CG]